MTILSTQDIERIKLAKVDYQAACVELVDICRLFFKSGTQIYWRNRGYLQSGTVVYWNGTAAYPTMRVENHETGRTVQISLHDVDWERMLNQAMDYEELVETLNKGAEKE